MRTYTVKNTPTCSDRVYFATFVTVGYESRCTHFASKGFQSIEKIAYIYEADVNPRAVKNRTIVKELGFQQILSSQCDLRSFVRELIRRCSEDKTSRPKKIAVDVSSMTRELMAIWVYALIETQITISVEVEFVYSHAEFSPPPESIPLSKGRSAVTPEFAGMFSDTTSPVMLILGLGYEPQLALSFIEYLEPAKLLVFEPAHHVKEYTNAIREKNDIFFRVIRGAPLIRYNVFLPYSVFQDVEAAIQGAAFDHRVHIAPYGLKLFAVCSLLAAGLHGQKVFVWNLNSIQSENDHDRIANGVISYIGAEIRSR